MHWRKTHSYISFMNWNIMFIRDHFMWKDLGAIITVTFAPCTDFLQYLHRRQLHPHYLWCLHYFFRYHWQYHCHLIQYHPNRHHKFQYFSILISIIGHFIIIFIIMYILKYTSSWTAIMSSILNFIIFIVVFIVVGLFYFKINDITVFILFISKDMITTLIINSGLFMMFNLEYSNRTKPVIIKSASKCGLCLPSQNRVKDK